MQGCAKAHNASANVCPPSSDSFTRCEQVCMNMEGWLALVVDEDCLIALAAHAVLSTSLVSSLHCVPSLMWHDVSVSSLCRVPVVSVSSSCLMLCCCHDRDIPPQPNHTYSCLLAVQTPPEHSLTPPEPILGLPDPSTASGNHGGHDMPR